MAIFFNFSLPSPARYRVRSLAETPAIGTNLAGTPNSKNETVSFLLLGVPARFVRKCTLEIYGIATREKIWESLGFASLEELLISEGINSAIATNHKHFQLQE